MAAISDVTLVQVRVGPKIWEAPFCGRPKESRQSLGRLGLAVS